MEGGDKTAARTGGGQARAKEREEVNQARSGAFVALRIQTMCHFLIKPSRTKMLKQKRDCEKQRWPICEGARRLSRSRGGSSSGLPQPAARDDL